MPFMVAYPLIQLLDMTTFLKKQFISPIFLCSEHMTELYLTRRGWGLLTEKELSDKQKNYLLRIKIGIFMSLVPFYGESSTIFHLVISLYFLKSSTILHLVISLYFLKSSTALHLVIQSLLPEIKYHTPPGHSVFTS